MLLKNIKTDKQKYNHIYRYWKKDDLMSLLEDYLLICGVDEDCMIFLEMEENLKTKKAILKSYKKYLKEKEKGDRKERIQ